MEYANCIALGHVMQFAILKSALAGSLRGLKLVARATLYRLVIATSANRTQELFQLHNRNCWLNIH